MENPAVIFAFIQDLMFVTRVDSAAAALGYSVIWMEDWGINALGVTAQDGGVQPDTRSAEPLAGPLGELVDRISRQQPALILVDLNLPPPAWRGWLLALKGSPATRRIPVLCYGSHMEAEKMQEAKRLGAEAAVARSRFSADLPELLVKYARLPDNQGLVEACNEPLSELAVKGLELFNRGQFFESHEELELAWKSDQTPARELYRAILQVAVAYLQIERGNYNGAVKMFWRARQWIEPLPERCRGVDIARLKNDAETAYQALIDLGIENIGEFDRGYFRPVHY